MRNGVDDGFSVAEVLQSHTVKPLIGDFLSSFPSFSSTNIFDNMVVPR